MTLADDYLLVPMQLDVMVLNQAAVAATSFLRFQMQYENLAEFTSPEPDPFEYTEGTLPAAGIYLHWTLPKALRHGRQNDDGTTSFPLVPNRWLVTRVQAGVAPAQALKAWVLVSDYLDLANNTGTSPFLDPATGKPTKMGRAWILGTIDSLDVQTQPFLRSVGPGSPTFSVYSPGVENIFAFVDDVTEADGVTVIHDAVFTYSVAGWYFDPANDPLSEMQWVSNLAEDGTYVLQPRKDVKQLPAFIPDWFVYSPSDQLPLKTITHSQSSGVPWSRDTTNAGPPNYPSDIPNKVKVAVGNTAIDALCALISPDPQNGPRNTEASLLQAFQYNLLETLDQPGSADVLKMEIRKHWFASSSGGTVWAVVQAERPSDPSKQSPVGPLTAQQELNLAALNQAQSELDRQTRILESMQWNLLGLWWKSNYSLANSDCIANNYPNLMRQLAFYKDCNNASGDDQQQAYDCQVRAQAAAVAQCQSDVANAKQALIGSLDPATRTLKPMEKPAYSYANDPVVLISGLGSATNFDPAGNVQCRLPSQILGSLTVDGNRYSVDGSGGKDIHLDVPALADPKKLLPGVTQSLNAENYLLSSWAFAVKYLADGNACPGTAGAPTTDPALDKVNLAICAVRYLKSSATQAPPLYAAQPWVQPWVPILMDWSVQVMEQPAYQSNSNGIWCDLQGGNWRFNGTDFAWCGATTADDTNFNPAHAAISLSGRTFITPHLSASLDQQIKNWVVKHAPRDPDLLALLKNLESDLEKPGIVDDLDLLSQRLSGMMAGMVERSYRQNPLPPRELAELIGDTHRGLPNPYPDERFTAPGTEAVWDFAPCCGTFFIFTGLTVIDSFGRTVDLLLANQSQYAGTQGQPPLSYFFPYTAPAMISPVQAIPGSIPGPAISATQNMVQLAPRMIQDSQLRLTLLSNDGTDKDIDLTAGSNPVCGWVLPNHLDRSLSVYAPDGTAWGELYLSQHDKGIFEPVWQGDPVGNGPRTIADIPNPYIRQMLASLGNNASDNRFYDLLKTIDETLWTINPSGQRQDQDLSVLVGRPLAVVRMDVSLKLRGLAYSIQDWEQTFDMSKVPSGGSNLPPAPLLGTNGGVFNQQWPVLLGSATLRDDGLIGYFADDSKEPANTWNTFYSVSKPADDTNSFLQQLGPDHCLKVAFTDDTVVAPDAAGGQRCGLTMLIDPRGKVHGFTGLLPVATIQVPDRFLTPALNKMSYLFRIGPLLSSPDQVRMPRPAEQNGSWTWFDTVLNTTELITTADDRARFDPVAPVAREGWLKFTPNSKPNTGKTNKA